MQTKFSVRKSIVASVTFTGHHDLEGHNVRMKMRPFVLRYRSMNGVFALRYLRPNGHFHINDSWRGDLNDGT
jgi:hypothetical protein